MAKPAEVNRDFLKKIIILVVAALVVSALAGLALGNRKTGRGRHLLSNMADGQLFLFPDPSKLLPDFFDDLGTSEIFISHILSVKKYETSL